MCLLLCNLLNSNPDLSSSPETGQFEVRCWAIGKMNHKQAICISQGHSQRMLALLYHEALAIPPLTGAQDIPLIHLLQHSLSLVSFNTGGVCGIFSQ